MGHYVILPFFSVGDTEEDRQRQLQHFYIDLEKFMNWLTEAETTANVLQDATHKERLLENPAAIRHLLEQWQVSTVHHEFANSLHFSSLCFLE